MDRKLTAPPEGVDLNPLSGEVFETLARFTAFPWPVLLAQCKRVGADPAKLTPETLASALPFIVQGVGRFTDPANAAAAEKALLELARR
jgi:hypothetical protein